MAKRNSEVIICCFHKQGHFTSCGVSLLSQIFSCDLASSPASSSLAHSNAERSPPANANNRAKSAGFLR